MNAVFIVGTGRSGTHFLARLLAGYEHAFDPFSGRENKRLLMNISTAAIHHRTPSDQTFEHYAQQIRSNTGVLIDQHHPNLFFVDKLLERVPSAVFLFPVRPAHQIVASMLKHKGVLSWYDYTRKNEVPFPNRFLGLDSSAALDALPLHMLCAHRVKAHRDAFEVIKTIVGSRVRAISYVDLLTDPNAVFQAVFTTQERKTLGSFTLVEEPRRNTVKKYESVLTPQQIDDIRTFEDSWR